ncbi:MAG: MurR/RpiR family transcriptional regulator [Spirochaetota bacterium]
MADMKLLDESKIKYVPRNCMLKIRSLYHVLKSAERKALDFLLAYPEKVKQLTITEFSDQAGCSEATVVRLARRLGYEGYTEMKADFAQSMKNNNSIGYEDIKWDDPPFTVFEKVVKSTVAALHDSLDIMNSEDYKKAVDAIYHANQIMFCGLGDASFVALEAQYRFLRAGKNSFAASDPDLQLIYGSKLQKGDVLIAISYTGRSRTIIDVVKQAKQSGATVIAITNFPISPIAKQADIVLVTAVFTQFLTVEVMSKRVTELCILESLSINYTLRRGEESINSLVKSLNVVDINKI